MLILQAGHRALAEKGLRALAERGLRAQEAVEVHQSLLPDRLLLRHFPVLLLDSRRLQAVPMEVRPLHGLEEDLRRLRLRWRLVGLLQVRP